MPNIYPLQDDFSSGEITPRLRGKTTSREYQNGLGFCENFEVTPQGSLEMRGGTQQVTILDGLTVVLHTFQRALDDDVIITITDEFLSLWNRDGPIFSEGGNLLTDPTFSNGLDSWEDFSVNGVATPIFGVGVNLFTEFDPGNPTNNSQALVFQGFDTPGTGNLHDVDAEWVMRAIPVGRIGIASVLVSVSEDIFSPPIAQFKIEFGPNGIPYPAEGTIIDASFTFTPTTIRTTIQLTVVYNPNTDGSSGACNVDMRGLAVTDTTIPPAQVQEPTPADWIGKLTRVQTAQDSALNRMFFTVFGGTMYDLVFDPDANSWTFAVFAPTPPTTDRWLDDQPYTCTIHQGRLWLGGTPNSPSTLWASETWDYDNFETDMSPTSEPPLEFILTSNGAIQWIDGLKFLLVGTDRGEVIGRSAGSVITASDFDFPLEQTWGSAPIQPAQVGSQVMFITADGTRVRSLFDGGDSVNGYDSEDINFIAENLTRSGITAIDFQQNPDYHLSMRLKNGTIVTSTFFQGGNVNAWFRLDTADSILSITRSNEGAGTSLWMAVERADELGALFLSLEVKNADNISGYNLDNYAVRSSSVTGLITDLDHLNGYTCGVVRVDEDGYTILTSQQPINGQITVEEIGFNSTILVGIPYTATAITLPLEGSNNAGTAQVQRRRFNEVFLRLFNSGIPKINGQRPPLRTPATLMNNSQGSFTGDTALHQVGWDEGIITIMQDLPLPTNITAIFGKAKGSAV